MSKSFIPYASHATWNLDRPEAAAISKSIIPNAGHAAWYLNRFKAVAIRKCAFPYFYGSSRYYTMSIFIYSKLFHNLVIR